MTEASLSAQINDIARFAPAQPSAALLREIASERGWCGLDDEDFEYAASLIDCGHQLPVALERLFRSVTHVTPATGEPVERWKCCACDSLHEDEDAARECCPPQVEAVYLCGRCGKKHWRKDMARDCCKPGSAKKTY